MKDKIDRLAVILEEEGEEAEEGGSLFTSLVLQIGSLEQLMAKYKDFWTYWETFKVLCETSKQPKYMLIVDKWEQLKFVTTAYFLKYWHTDLTVDELDAKEEVAILYDTPHEKLNQEVNVEKIVKHVEDSDEIIRSTQEERKTFYIRAVIDPRTDAEMSIQQAVDEGVMDQKAGLYVNPKTGHSIPIPTAMSRGLILVDYTSTRKSAETKESFGLITIKTTKENKPYVITGVVDSSADDAVISFEKATEKGIIDLHDGVYRDPITKREQLLADAIDGNLVSVADQNGQNGETELVTKTYAIHHVVNQKLKKKITFSEAVRDGILDKNTGSYLNNITGERIYVGDAIMRGFLKATVVEDPTTLDIDPENKMVVSKVENIRKRLLQPMKALSAFKQAMKK
ncbi:unnamed protein product [Owenia fusiformis]|uniref:Uncharacterized protein n=1 Tax=Owenia fusiformis TaxID=6347 RepID=A0A8J1UEU0_OWEFU|nr:unnamed protein product [Owenia fusiformis]